jgi:hypothetical protein
MSYVQAERSCRLSRFLHRPEMTAASFVFILTSLSDRSLAETVLTQSSCGLLPTAALTPGLVVPRTERTLESK